MSKEFLHWLTLGELGLAGLTVVSLLFITAPYGRHARAGWGPDVSARLGWFIMEWPAVFLVSGIFLAGMNAAPEGTSFAVSLVLLGLWQLHYINRTLIYPLRIPTKRKMPLFVAFMGMSFQLLNGVINAYWLAEAQHGPEYFSDPRFVGGVLLFLLGYLINQRSDRTLMKLRKETPAGTYAVPRGFLYDFISCPNYFGEILEWTGFAIACWSLPGLAFAVYTLANLGPRALAHHRWYREKFPDYPPQRKALIPFIL